MNEQQTPPDAPQQQAPPPSGYQAPYQGQYQGQYQQPQYRRLTRTWRAGDRVELVLAMPPRLVTAHPRVDAVRGTAALARGPVVYCLEHADLPPALAAEVFEDLELDPSTPLTATRDEAGIAPVTLRASIRARAGTADALYRPATEAGAPDKVAATVPAIPYYLWANRAAGPMRVWIPLASPGSPT